MSLIGKIANQGAPTPFPSPTPQPAQQAAGATSLLATTANQGAPTPFVSPPLPPVQQPAAPSPPTSAPVASTLPGTTTTPLVPGLPTANYNTNDPLGLYFQNNQQAGDTWAQVKATLDQYGLGGLYNTVEQGIVMGWDSAQTYQHIRETPEYQTRFAGNIQRVANGLQPLSETQYLANEAAYQQADRAFGLPSNFHSQADYANLIGGDLAPTEYQSRLVNFAQQVQESDPGTKAALASMYGITDSDLLAHAIDPTKTEALLHQQLVAGQIGGAATNTGWGALSSGQAEGLGALGVSQSQATAGFNKLAGESQLMQGLPGASEQGIGQQQQLDAVFSNNAQDQKLIADRAAQRVAAFAGGGAFTNGKNITGIGSANETQSA